MQFLRFGYIPKNERSAIHCNEEIIGYEKGVSVWNCFFDVVSSKYALIYPYFSSRFTECDFENDCTGYYYKEKPIFLVEGDIVSFGSDGEPCIRNVRIIKQLTRDQILNPYETSSTSHVIEVTK